MKTLAIRLDEELHAQLSVLAQLRESTITDEIRSALEGHLENAKTSPELSGRAQAVLDDIERESQARQAAIATLFRTGTVPVPSVSESSEVLTPATTKSTAGKTVKP